MTKLVHIVLIFCLFACNTTSSKKAIVVSTEKNNLVLHPNEGKWYYQDKPFTGNAIVYNSDSTKKESLSFLNGKKNGFETKWFKNGSVQKKSFYKNNKLEGESKAWWPNGNLASESFYSNGKGNGIQKKWHSNGQMSRQNTLKNGVEEGMQQAWLENGKIYVNCEIRNGRTFGLKKAILCYELKEENVQR